MTVSPSPKILFLLWHILVVAIPSYTYKSIHLSTSLIHFFVIYFFGSIIHLYALCGSISLTYPSYLSIDDLMSVYNTYTRMYRLKRERIKQKKKKEIPSLLTVQPFESRIIEFQRTSCHIGLFFTVLLFQMLFFRIRTESTFRYVFSIAIAACCLYIFLYT